MPMRDAETVTSVYDSVAPAYDALLPDLRAEQPVDRAMISAFGQEAAESGSHRVLDAGCGTGRMLAVLKEMGLHPVGVDLSPGMVEQARRRQPEAELRVADLGALPYADGAFGGVLAWYCLIHHEVLEMQDALAELARVTAPGGVLLTAFHLGSGSVETPHAYGTNRTVTKHLRGLEEIADLLSRTGWEMLAAVRREAVAEKHPQGFLMARRTH